MVGYDPTFTWVAKLGRDKCITCNLFTFVDDERVVGQSEELNWQAAHKLAAKQAICEYNPRCRVGVGDLCCG